MIPRYNRQKLAVIWSDNNKFKIWTEIECLIAEQLSKLGIIPKKAAIEIRKKAKFNVDEIKEIEKETKHDVIAYINNVSSYIGKQAKYFHHGVTSSDIIDTTFSIFLNPLYDCFRTDIQSFLPKLDLALMPIVDPK